MSETSFPRQHARTRRFTLGVPRGFDVSRDGSAVLFLRSRGGADPLMCLYRLDVASGEESLVVDPASLLAGATEDLPPEERARRERARESSEGIVRFATDREQRVAAFDLSGRLFVTQLPDGCIRELPATVPVADPRPDPTGARVAYVSGGAMRVVSLDGTGDRVLAAPEAEHVSYGLAEFVAAEEMDRGEGYWWSPAGDRLLVARVDVSPVRRWWISDPAHPDREPVPVAYPVAGSANAVVTLEVIALDGSRVPVEFDRAGHEYLARVDWSEAGLVIAVQSRDQREIQLLEVDPDTGRTSLLREDHDDDWLDLVVGVPARLDDGSLVWTADGDGARRLVVGDEQVTGPDLQVRDVLGVDGDSVLFGASSDPTEVGLWSWSRAGGLLELAGSPGAGVRWGCAGGGTVVVVERRLDRDGTEVSVLRGGAVTARIASLEESPVLRPEVTLLRTGPRELCTALLLPSGHEPGSALLPVLLDPYGGPGAQRVVAARSAFLTSQWFADQGFAVIVADGRGAPGRGPQWERAIRGDLAGPVLEDQVEALHATADKHHDLDLSRVAIRGWSFGGFLAALAVLRRPDVFHAAVAGAPVTDWRLYDTHYTERYLGRPEDDSGAYDRSSLLPDAARLERPLLLIHGLADDNVVVANTLRLSALLTAAGRPHAVLPLSGVTHMTPQEEVAENLLLLQLDFLRKALAT